ncbi:UDP-N-acetylmuramate dehydrogenase [Campylobacter sp. VBCF_06 NA8]|uniref:UDP-N-acetylmuramate dehydrogenase n=1 Tax=Campylobacter sp. VBCF_06 NA8 TaxID=2983822 RepID=UPI0022E9A095|nr:UDP-N-acetylmuramate dehydrogenase [Campylobacter sp. VBCF_06 NA8]MDA3045804.1 UDP-N-acetylmuramate dehydrogenase [Campylobacter sp. VBCF_06 NA8]
MAKIYKEIDFSKYSSVKIGGVEKVEVLDENSEFNGFVVGGANNLLISPNPPQLGILSDKFDFISLDGDILKIGAKTKSAKIYNFAKQQNLANFEFLKNIPGTLGGLLTMNAGLMGFEISQNLISVRTNLGEFGKDELNFAYRHSEINGIILEAKFKVSHGFNATLSEAIAQKRANQPKGASFGSCFKNPQGESAGRLIEAVGLKGFRVGGCGLSEIHANFLINYGDATYFEAITLINLAKMRVKAEFGVDLHEEVVIL